MQNKIEVFLWYLQSWVISCNFTLRFSKEISWIFLCLLVSPPLLGFVKLRLKFTSLPFILIERVGIKLIKHATVFSKNKLIKCLKIIISISFVILFTFVSHQRSLFDCHESEISTNHTIPIILSQITLFRFRISIYKYTGNANTSHIKIC